MLDFISNSKKKKIAWMYDLNKIIENKIKLVEKFARVYIPNIFIVNSNIIIV